MSDEDSDFGDTNSDLSSEAAAEVLISHEVVKKEWSLGELKDIGLLKHIGDLTKCRLEPKSEKKTIVVKGEDTEAVDKAIAKLDAEWLAVVQKTTLPMIHDFECTEGEVNAMLQLLALKELKDRRLTTTLVPPSGRLFKNLGSYQIVIMIKDGNVHPVGQPRALDRNTSAEVNSKLWMSYTNKPLPHMRNLGEKASGKEPLAAARAHHTPFLPPSKTGAISQWVEQSATESASDPFVPAAPPGYELPRHEPPKPDPSLRSQDPALEQRSPPKRAGRMRKPKGAAKEDPCGPAQAIVSTEPLPDPFAGIDLFIQDTCQASVAASPFDSTQAATPVSQPQSTTGKANGMKPPSKGKDAPQAKPPVATPSVKSYAASARPSVHHNGLPALEPPYMPAVSSSSTTTSNTPHWNYQTVSNAKEGRLIDFDISTDTVEIPKDRAQKENEVASRQFRNTMRQRKPSAQTARGPQGATSTFETVATQLLEFVRSSRGLVNIETTIGRLLIDPRSGTGEYKKARFAIPQWPLVFPNKHGVVKLETNFTGRLTSLASDADFVLDLKTPSGRRMFTEQPCERQVTYRFTCSTSHNSEDDIFVDVKDDKGSVAKSEVRKAPKLYGSLNWHYPKRYWDARLAVHSSDHVNQEQRKAAEEIINTIEVSLSSEDDIVEISTSCPSRDFSISKIQMRRETHHRSIIYPDIILKLCEVQEFEIELPKPDGSYLCRAHTNSRKQMVRENRLWWEASLASVAAMKRFKENETLEVGGKTTWTAKDIIDAEVVRNMSFLSRDIVTSIDSVGYHNKGPKVSSTEKQSDTLGPTLGFW